MAQLIGSRLTSQSYNETRNVRVMDPKIYSLYPEEGVLLTFMQEVKNREATTDRKFEWFEDEFVAEWAQNSATAVANTTASTLVTVTDGTLFTVGDVFIVPKAATSSTAPEACLVTGISSNTLTVTRAFAGTTADTIDASGALMLVGPAYEEGASFATAKSAIPVAKYGYTQIFQVAAEFSGTQLASKLYGADGSERKREHAKKWLEHRRNIARAFYLGGGATYGATAGPNGKPIATSASLRSAISTNVWNAGGLLTSKYLFDTVMPAAFRYGSTEKTLFGSAKVVAAIEAFARRHRMLANSETKFGVKVSKVETTFGVLNVVYDRILENGISGKNGNASIGFIVDLPALKYRFLSDNGYSRDNHWMIQDEKSAHRTADGVKDILLAEVGLQIRNEKFHGMIYNVTDYVE